MIIYQNSEWSVTDEGVEGIGDEKGYWIKLSRIADVTERNGSSYYGWPIHIAEKECVPVEPFITAFLAALRYFAGRVGLCINELMLECTLATARQIATLPVSPKSV